MDFTKATNNGIQPPSDYKTKPSKLGVAVSNTATIYGRPVTLTAISDAAMFKSTFVTFYSEFTPTGSSTSTTLTLGTGTFVTTTNAPLVVNTLGTGTHNIYVTWPGENKFAPQTTITNPVLTAVDPGVNPGGELQVYVSPATETVVTGEGNITLSVIYTGSLALTGKFYFYDDHVLLGSADIVRNAGALVAPSLSAGTRTITATWTGDTIAGTIYQGLSTSTQYTVLRGTNFVIDPVLTVTPVDHGVFQEGNITLTAVLNTTTNLPGNFNFYNGTGLAQTTIGTAPIVGNSATVTVPNNLAIGTYTFSSQWDGNQASHPRYLERTSNPVTWTEASRETVTSFTIHMVQPASYFSERVEFIGTATGATVPQLADIQFYDNGVLLGTGIMVNGEVSFNTTTLTTGTHVIQARYTGSDIIPKFYGTQSNTLTVQTTAGFPLDFSLAYQANTYLDPNPGYYVNEAINVVLTNNSSTSIVGSTATITVDDIEVYGSREIIFGDGIYLSGTNLSHVIPGTKVYADPYLTVLLGTVNSNTNTLLTLDTSAPSGYYPVWFIGPHYHVLGNVTFTGNTATTTTSFANTATVIAYADWPGGRFDSENHYYMIEHPMANPINVVKRPMPALGLSTTATTGYVGDPVDVQFGVGNTVYDLSGFTATLINGTITNSISFPSTASYTTSTKFWNSGTQTFSGVYYGNGVVHNISDNNRTYYLKGTTATSTASVTILERHLNSNFALQADQTIAVIDEPINFTVVSNSSTFITNSTASWYANDALFSTSTFSTQIARTTATFTATGTESVYMTWSGGYGSDGKYYVGRNQSNTLTIPVHARRDWAYPITLSSSSITNSTRLSTTLTARIDPSAPISGTINFVEGTTIIGTSTFINGVASISIPPGGFTTGTHPIKVTWDGTTTAPKFYGTQSNTLTETILNPSVTTASMVLSTSSYRLYKINRSQNPPMTATFPRLLYGYPNHSPTGTLTLSDGVNTIGVSTVTNGQANPITWTPTQQLDAGPLTLRASYNGDGWNYESTATLAFEAKQRADIVGATLTATGQYTILPWNFTLDLKGAQPIGSITLTDSSATYGSSTVNGSGIATYNNVFLSSGTHVITANVPRDIAIEATTTSITVTATNVTPTIGITDVTIANIPYGTPDTITYNTTTNSYGYPGGVVTDPTRIQFRIPALEALPQELITNKNITINMYPLIYGPSTTVGGNPNNSFPPTFPGSTSSWQVGALLSSETIQVGNYSTGTYYSYTATTYMKAFVEIPGTNFYQNFDQQFDPAVPSNQRGNINTDSSGIRLPYLAVGDDNSTINGQSKLDLLKGFILNPLNYVHSHHPQTTTTFAGAWNSTFHYGNPFQNSSFRGTSVLYKGALYRLKLVDESTAANDYHDDYRIYVDVRSNTPPDQDTVHWIKLYPTLDSNGKDPESMVGYGVWLDQNFAIPTRCNWITYFTGSPAVSTQKQYVQGQSYNIGDYFVVNLPLQDRLGRTVPFSIELSVVGNVNWNQPLFTQTDTQKTYTNYYTPEINAEGISFTLQSGLHNSYGINKTVEGYGYFPGAYSAPTPVYSNGTYVRTELKKTYYQVALQNFYYIEIIYAGQNGIDPMTFGGYPTMMEYWNGGRIPEGFPTNSPTQGFMWFMVPNKLK